MATKPPTRLNICLEATAMAENWWHQNMQIDEGNWSVSIQKKMNHSCSKTFHSWDAFDSNFFYGQIPRSDDETSPNSDGSMVNHGKIMVKSCEIPISDGWIMVYSWSNPVKSQVWMRCPSRPQSWPQLCWASEATTPDVPQTSGRWRSRSWNFFGETFGWVIWTFLGKLFGKLLAGRTMLGCVPWKAGVPRNQSMVFTMENPI